MKEKIYTDVPSYGKIDLIDYYDEFVSYYTKCEMETKKWVVENVKNGWVIFDCGANIGYYSIIFSKLSPNGKVYAFEPTDTIDKLINNLNYNNIKNVYYHRIALSNKTGVRKDRVYKIWGKDPEFSEYNFMTIDHFVLKYKIEKLNLIKIDVDSYDFEVLQGAVDTLERFNPFVIVELNHALSLRNTSNYEALKWMMNLGYDSGLVLDNENVVFKKNHNFEHTLSFKLLYR